jgi:hypothetical protein
MIDFEAARARADWLARLQVGDRVILRTPFGARPATVVDILSKRLTLGWHTLGDGDVTTWIHRDTGDLPGGRLYIEPESPPEFDSPISGGEAA